MKMKEFDCKWNMGLALARQTHRTVGICHNDELMVGKITVQSNTNPSSSISLVSYDNRKRAERRPPSRSFDRKQRPACMIASDRQSERQTERV